MFFSNKAVAVTEQTVLLIKVGKGFHARLVDHLHHKVEFRAQIPLIYWRAVTHKIIDNFFHRSLSAVVVQPAFLILPVAHCKMLVAGTVNIVPDLAHVDKSVRHEFAFITMGNFVQAAPAGLFAEQPEVANGRAGFGGPAIAVISRARAAFVRLDKVAVADIPIGNNRRLERKAKQRVIKIKDIAVAFD